MDKHKLAEDLFETMMKSAPKPWVKNLEEVSHGEKAVLGYLIFKKNNVSAGELSEEFQVSTARIAAVLKMLEKKEHIERRPSEEDGRKIVVSVTDEGRKMILAKREKMIENLTSLVEELGEEDTLEYIRIQKKVADIMKNKFKEWRKGC